MIELDHDIITPVILDLIPSMLCMTRLCDFSRTAYDRRVEGTGYTHPATPTITGPAH